METLATLWISTGWPVLCGLAVLTMIGAHEAFEVLTGQRCFVERSSGTCRYELAGIEDFVVAERIMLARSGWCRDHSLRETRDQPRKEG